MIAGVMQATRLARWAGERTFADRLVLVLHVGYAFVPIGFLLLGAAILWPSKWPASAGLHAWTAGAIGLMTLAMMTRVSLGHAGQQLTASAATQMIYFCALVAAFARVAAAFNRPAYCSTPPLSLEYWRSAALRGFLGRYCEVARQCGVRE